MNQEKVVFLTKLDFWRYDEEIGEWNYDSEVRQGEQQMESTMKTNIMLVVDNSKSLGDDFKKVQDAAVEFVGQLFRESQGKEVFRVGVIGFSTVKFTRIREITTLDASNYREIVEFIRGLVYITMGWKFKSPWYINAAIHGPGESLCIGVGYSLFEGR